MDKKRCLNCGRMFYPYKHIINQRYCSKKECQRVRNNKWRYLKLKYDDDYKTNKKESQRKWKTNNPNYWTYYKKRLKDNKKLLPKIMVKILLKRDILTNLRKAKATNCNCRLILIT